MNVQIITSSYPAFPGDPSGTAGLFVRSFALELVKQGHRVVLQPVARKKHYETEEGLIIEPLPWEGGDNELASLNLLSPINWKTIFRFFKSAKSTAIETHKKYQIDQTLCMWAVPSGIFGYWIKKYLHKPYDIWVLGSDIWKIKKIPIIGKFILHKVINGADRVFADGINLSDSVEKISGKSCEFLPSSRDLSQYITEKPQFDTNELPLRLLFVGRYHHNKGPDILIESVAALNENIRKDIHVQMYGVGPLKPELKNLIEKNNLNQYISLHNGIQSEDLCLQLSQADYLVIPSRIESIPVIFSDALQTETPVISMPVGDLKDLISTHRCGILANNITAQDLAQAIELACDKTQYSNFVKNAKQLARKFSCKHTAEQWINSINSAANETALLWEKRSRMYEDCLEGVLFKNLPGPINKYIHNWHMAVIRKTISTNHVQTLLDIGCGYGRLSLELKSYFPSLMTTGLDISQHYVDLYNKKLQSPAFLSTAENLPDGIGQFDCILVVTVLMYVPYEKIEQSIVKIWGHLNNGGVLIIIEPDTSSQFFQNPFGLKKIFFKKQPGVNTINTAGRYFNRKEMRSFINALNDIESIDQYGIPFLTFFIAPIYCIAKLLPEKMLTDLLNIFFVIDKLLKKCSRPTLHGAYIIRKKHNGRTN